MNPPDNEHSVLGFDLTRDIRYELTIACIDVARIQRAPKCTDHSTGSRRDHVIQSGGVRFLESGGINFVMLRDGAVNAENNILRFARQAGNSQWASLALNSNLGNINDVGHNPSYCFSLRAI
jgi:hypothetical protein